jgi:glutamate-ammonia-ligase adenylyltransferase
LISALTVMTGEGGLYEVDMRLRPSGNKGPVAVSFETFAKYQAEEAWTWERLALTRARVIAGPSELWARVEGVIRTSLTTPRDIAKTLADIADMRARLDRERPAKSPWDLKEAKGGLFDVEFMVQGLQLTSATTHPSVLHANTLDALRALGAAGCIDSESAMTLERASRLYQGVTQALRLTVEGSFAVSDASTSLRQFIVRSAGAASFDDVEPMLAAVQADVRALFGRLTNTARPDG